MTEIIAHRGASAERPENTLAAFDEALRQGCDAIELDVQLTRDGVPVVWHDRTLARAGAPRATVATTSWEDLRRLDAGSWFDSRYRGAHIPTLAEVLERYGGRTRLLLEIKAREGRGADPRRDELVERLVAELRRRRLEKHVRVLCFDGAVLARCAALAPALPRVLNVELTPYLSRALRGRLATLSALSADIRSLTPLLAGAVHRAGCPLLTFTCNTPRRVERALRAGAIGVMSDRPGWLRDYLERRRP